MKLWALSPKAQEYRDAKVRTAVDDTGTPLSKRSDYDVDMWCFNRHPWKHPRKHEFLLRAFQHQWGPSMMLEETVNGTRYENYWAVRIARDFTICPILDLMGSGSSSKTHMSTCCAYTIWKSSPFATSVYLSTTTGEGADARAWATVNQIYREDKYRFGKMINSTRTLVMEEESEISEENAKFRDLRNAIKCVLIPSGNEGKNVVGAISGRKNNRVIWVCDEFSHMDMGVLQGRVNLFTNVAAGGWAQFVGCCNGPHDGSVSFIDCEPQAGWASVNKDQHWRWETRSGVCLYFNGDKSPNLQVPRGTPAPFPKLIDWEVRDLILRNCWNDENTPEFWTQFFGFPPSVNISDTVLTKAFMSNGGAFLAAEWRGETPKVLGGFDTGFKKGGDPCAAAFAKLGKDVRGKTIVEFEPDAIIINLDATSKDAFEAQIARKFVDECVKRGCHDIAMDVTGDGGIMLQAIEQDARARGWQLNVLPISFSGSADDKIVIPGEKRKASEQFANKVSQLWAMMRVSVGNSVVRGLSERGKSTEQLCQRRFITDEKKRFQVESKKLMKQRIKRSPDQADAACCCGFLAMKHGLSGADVPKVAPKPPVRPEERAGQRYAQHGAQRRAYTGR